SAGGQGGSPAIDATAAADVAPVPADAQAMAADGPAPSPPLDAQSMPPAAEAGPPVTPGSITCGSISCNTDTEMCCAGELGVMSCVRRDVGRGFASPRRCD